MLSFHDVPPRRNGVHFGVYEIVAECVMLGIQLQRRVNTEKQTILVLSHQDITASNFFLNCYHGYKHYRNTVKILSNTESLLFDFCLKTVTSFCLSFHINEDTLTIATALLKIDPSYFSCRQAVLH